jgi:WD40 repeat protein
MRRQCPFPADAVGELDLQAPVRPNSSRVRFSRWKPGGLVNVALCTIIAVAFFAISTDADIREPEAQIWTAGASDHGCFESVVFAEDGKTIASVDSDGYAALWDVATGLTNQSRPDRLVGIRSLAFSPDRRTLATGNVDSTITIRDVESLEPLSTLGGHPTCVRAVAFSPDGKMLASASADGTLILWRTTPGYSPVHQIRSPSMIVLIGFSPDGTILATTHNDGEVRVRDVASPAQSSVISCESKLPRGIAFSPDGRTLALSSIVSSKILFWDLHEKRFTDSLIGPARSVQSLAYSPDGKVLVATGNTGILHFWNLAADRRGATVRCGTSRVRSAKFSPDGRTLASGDNDHCVRLWDVNKILTTANGQ